MFCDESFVLKGYVLVLWPRDVAYKLRLVYISFSLFSLVSLSILGFFFCPSEILLYLNLRPLEDVMKTSRRDRDSKGFQCYLTEKSWLVIEVTVRTSDITAAVWSLLLLPTFPTNPIFFGALSHPQLTAGMLNIRSFELQATGAIVTRYIFYLETMKRGLSRARLLPYFIN